MKSMILYICIICSVFVSYKVKADIFECNNFYTFERHGTVFKNKINYWYEQLPMPVKHIKIEGEMPGSLNYNIGMKALKDMDVMQLSATAWAAGIEKDKSLFISSRYLLSWVNIYTPNFNPVDEERLSQLIKTYAIIKNTLSKKDNLYVKTFLTSWGYGYLKRMQYDDDDSSQWRSNWQSHRIRLVTLIAVATNNKDMLFKVKKYYISQIQRNIYSDGSTWDFKERDAIRYVVGDLGALLDAALAAKTQGEDWYNLKSPTNTSLRLAVYWLLPYISGEKKHEEFKNSHEEFDRRRIAAKVDGFGGEFNPEYGSKLLWIATLLDDNIRQLKLGARLEKPLYYEQCF